MKKNINYLLLIFATLLFLSACGGSDSSSADSNISDVVDESTIKDDTSVTDTVDKIAVVEKDDNNISPIPKKSSGYSIPPTPPTY